MRKQATLPYSLATGGTACCVVDTRKQSKVECCLDNSAVEHLHECCAAESNTLQLELSSAHESSCLSRTTKFVEVLKVVKLHSALQPVGALPACQREGLSKAMHSKHNAWLPYNGHCQTCNVVTDNQ